MSSEREALRLAREAQVYAAVAVGLSIVSFISSVTALVAILLQ